MKDFPMKSLGAIEVKQPFPFEALPRVWRWIATFRGRICDDFAPQTEDDFILHMVSKWNTQKSWAVYADQELGGLITFERISPWLGTAHIILKPDFKGKGIAVQACKMALAEMFAEGIGKLGFYPLAGNKALGSLIVSLGAKRECKLKAHTLCNGKPADSWVYGLTAQDFKEQ